MATSGELSAAAPAATAVVPKGRDAHYLRTVIALSAAVYLGFYFTYFGPMLGGSYPKASPTVHVHGWTFFAWYLLLPVQAFLVHTRRVPWHRTLGALSGVLATMMIVTGAVVIGVQMEIARTAKEPTFFSFFGRPSSSRCCSSPCFYVAAILLRRRAPYHKRLIVVASAAGSGAAMFRIFSTAFGQVIWVPITGVLSTNLFIIAGMIHDRRRDGRVHPAYVIGLSVCVALEAGMFLLSPTPVGQAVASGLAWIGRMLGFLY
jgi:hypothetical protein